MRPIPKDLNLDRLVGQQLQQICIGAHDLQFKFEGEDRIRCTGVVTVTIEEFCHDVFTEDGWKDASPLAKIAGRDVVSWKIESAYVFAITLTPAAVIRFISEDSPYEDFVVDPEVLVW